MTHRAAVLVAVLLLGATPASGQPLGGLEPAALRGDSTQTRKRLAEARNKLLLGKHADATDELQRILDESGDDLIPIDDPRANHPHQQYRPARWVAHHILTMLPPDALRAYQDRIDEPARKLLEAGRRDRDPRPLWQLLDRYFVSRPAQEGLLLLGDLLFERGQFRTAEQLWRRLLPRTADRWWERLLVEDPDIPYPTPAADPAAVRARVALAVIFQGEADRARQELVRLAALHPGARGPFAGGDGPYAAALEAFLVRPPRFLPDAGAAKGDWPTFAGGPGRTGRAPGRMPSLWPDGPTWRMPLFSDGPTPSGPTILGRQPFGHPVILDGKVYVTDGTRVRAFDLQTRTPLGPTLTPPSDSPFPPYSPPQCSTLSAADGRLFARFGPAVIRSAEPARPGARPAGESALVCFAPNTGLLAQKVPVREVWRVAPPVHDGQPPAVWEGAPLVANGRMWAALVRFEGGRAVHSIACFDPADPDRAPEHPAWVVDVCDGQVPSSADRRTRQELLTLAGRNIVFGSTTGAVVAVDAATGRRAWAFRYPRSARRAADVTSSADPAPAVALGGRVFVAPADADHVYALDEETGQLLWESGPVEGAQILGVTRNRVIVSVAPPVRGIRGLAVANGSYHPEDGGWIQHDGGGVLGYGRGLVTEGLVVWPTRDGLFFLDPESGRQVGQRRKGAFGNLAYADGVLVVVTPNEVLGYVAEGGLFDPRPPENPERKRFDQLIGAAERELDDDTEMARARLLAVARGGLPARMRAWAAARLLLLAPCTDDLQKLPADLRAVLTPELEAEWVVSADGSLVTLGTLVALRTGQKLPAGSKPENPTLPADRKRADAPTLTAQAAVDRSVRLPPTACPLRPIPGAPLRPRHLFAIAGPKLIVIPLDNEGTSTRLAAGIFTHAADLDAGLVAVGPHAVAVYGTGREPAWVFRVPDLDPLPDRPGRAFVRVGEPDEPSGLSSFVLAGSWLFARLGEHHLIALDLQARRVAWVLGAHGRPGYEPLVFPTCPRFEPHFFVSGELLVVQLSDGRRWCVRAASGRVLDASGNEFRGPVPAGFGDETARVAWPAPPVEVEPGRLAVADGPGLVRLLELDTGKASPLYAAEGSASLSGEPPQVRAFHGTVLVAVRRNHGVELDRAEPNGRPSGWPGGSAFFDASRIDLSAADADSVRVYVPAGGRLFAVALRDGSAVWDVALPETNGAGGWVVRAGKKAVIAYPEFAIPAEPVAGVWDRAVRSFPTHPLGWRLPGLALGLYDAWVDRAVPVLLFDPQTGTLLKRIDLPARGPAVTAYFEGDLAVIAAGDRVAWVN